MGIFDSGIGGFFSGIGDGIGGFFSGAADTVKNVVNTVYNDTVGFGHDIISGAKDVFTGPATLMNKAIDVGGAAVTSLGKNIENSISDVTTNASNAVQGLGSSFAMPLAFAAAGIGALWILKK